MALKVSIEVYHSAVLDLMNAAEKNGIRFSDFDELLQGAAVFLNSAVPEKHELMWKRIDGDPITGPQLDLIKKHITGKAKDRIVRWLGPLRPSELTKPEASVLLDFITKKEDWPQWTF